MGTLSEWEEGWVNRFWFRLSLGGIHSLSWRCPVAWRYGNSVGTSKPTGLCLYFWLHEKSLDNFRVYRLQLNPLLGLW